MLAEAFGLTVEDVLLLAVTLLSLGAFALLVSEALRPRAAQPVGAGSNPPSEGEGERERRKERRERNGGKESERSLADEILAAAGVDRAMAREFLAELRRALKEGRVRPALVSEECPNGRVVYDFARSAWLCVTPGGDAHPLGQRLAGEEMEVEDGV